MTLIDEFLAFETKKRLFNMQIDGVYFWPLVRSSVNNMVFETLHVTSVAHDKSKYQKLPFVKQAVRKAGFIWNRIWRNPMRFITKKDILVLNHPRRVLDGGFYQCLYTDMFLTEYTGSRLVLQQAYQRKHFRPNKTKNLRYTDHIDKRIADESREKDKQLSAMEMLLLKELATTINEHFQVALDVYGLANRMAERIIRFKLYRDYFRKILRRLRPRLIIEVVYYDPICMALNAAAKEMNIPTVELQHGTMGREHIAYNFLEKRLFPSFPDYVFLFGRFWKDETRLPLLDERLKIVGWPYYERKINTVKVAGTRRDSSKQTILFISQGDIGHWLSKAAADLSGMIDEKKYNIIYKLHPGEYLRWRSEYTWLLNDKICVVCDNEHDIHHYFAIADVQVGVYSTALFEGLGYGLGTYIWKLPKHERVKELYGSGMATLVDSPAEFIDCLERPKKQVELQDIERFWQPDSLENMLREVEGIMSDH